MFLFIVSLYILSRVFIVIYILISVCYWWVCDWPSGYCVSA